MYKGSSSDLRLSQLDRYFSCLSLLRTTFTMPFEVYAPDNLTFQDYIAVVQTSRILADGFDKKVGDIPVIHVPENRP